MRNLNEIRKQIARDDYIDDDKLDVTAERLLADLRLRREIGRTICGCKAGSFGLAVIVAASMGLVAVIVLGVLYAG